MRKSATSHNCVGLVSFRACKLRLKLLALLLFYAGLVEADWTGVALELGNAEADWKFDSGQREVDTSSISFQIEERSSAGLVFGGSMGYLSTRVKADTSADTRRFDAQYLKIYLRQEFVLSESIALHGSLSYRYNSGSDDDDADNSADIEWRQSSFQLGLNLRFANFRLTPYAAYYDIDGDISDDSGTEVFELDDPISRGIRFDYFVEESAFVRFQIQSGDQAGSVLSFIRRY